MNAIFSFQGLFLERASKDEMTVFSGLKFDGSASTLDLATRILDSLRATAWNDREIRGKALWRSSGETNTTWQSFWTNMTRSKVSIYLYKYIKVLSLFLSLTYA